MILAKKQTRFRIGPWFAYQIMKARVNDTSEDINTDLYFEQMRYAAYKNATALHFQAGQMFNQPRAMAKVTLGLSAEWEGMSVEERVSKGWSQPT